MRKWVTFLMTFLAGSVSYANADIGSELFFEAGYRKDSLDFSIQVPTCEPVFKTTSRFKDLDIFQIGLHGRTNLGCNFYGRASFSWGWILDGDFEESTRITPEISEFSEFGIAITTQSENVIDGRFVLDFDVAIGYPFYFCDCSMYVAPVIGYEVNEQNLFIDDVERVSFSDSFFFESDSSCCGRDDKFVAHWYGPFIGLDFVYSPHNECWNLWAELEYHYARFKAKRHEFAGFSVFDGFDSTSRDAHGWVASLGAEYAFCSCWTVGLDFKWQDWSANRRHHDCAQSDLEYFFGSLSEDRYKSHVKWHSFAVNVTVGRSF